jgi:hypothetical protein
MNVKKQDVVVNARETEEILFVRECAQRRNVNMVGKIAWVPLGGGRFAAVEVGE